MTDLERLHCSFSETDLQLVVGADDLKSIERDIDLFLRNEDSVQMIVTSPGPRLTGAIRFGAVVARERGMSASISIDEALPRLVVDKIARCQA